MKIFRVKVKPKAKQSLLRHEADGSLTVHLKAPPIDGKANAELIQLLASEFNVPKSSLRIKAGATSKFKLVEMDED